MNPVSILTYTSFIVYLHFGIYILYLNRKEKINILFAILSFSLCIWSIADTFYFVATTKEKAMFFWRISTIGWVLSPAIMLHLMLLVSKFNKFADKLYKLIIIYLPAIVLEYLALTTNFYLKDIFQTPYGWADLIDPELFITKAFLFYYIFYSLLSLFFVYLWGKNTQARIEKRQAAIIFLSSLISLIPSFFTNTMQIAFGADFQIPAFAEVFILIWVFGILFAIKKYNFLTREKEISELNEKIMLEQKIVSIQSEYIKNQNFLLEILLEYFKREPRSNNIFEYLAEKLYISGNIKLLMITEYNSENQEFTLKAIRCENDIEIELHKIIKSTISQPKVILNNPDIFSKLLSSHLIKIEGGFYEAILNAINKDIVDRLVERFNLGDAYSFGFSANNKLFGAATLIVERGKELENIDFMEILTNMLSLILQKHVLDVELRKSEELHRAIFEYSDDCIYILDSEGKILSISPSFERITKYKISDLINQSMAEIIHPEDINLAFHMLNEVVKGGTPQRKIIRIIDKDGGTLFGEFAATKFKLADGKVALLGIGRDITERIKNEELIKSYQRELELKTSRIETVGIMAAGVLHDLNNILMNIAGRTNKIKNKSISDPDIIQYLDDIDKTLKVAQRLSKNLFDISGGKIDEQNITLNQLIRENINLLVKEQKYKIQLNIPDHLPEITLNNSQFTQVLNNLVLNALQAMPEGGRLKIETDIKHLDGKEFLVLSVEDSGQGIPQEVQNKIFDPFFTTKPNGTGLGLPTVKSIIKSNGGEIELFSTPERGTTFKLYIPTNQKSTTLEKAEIENSKTYNMCKNILVIDDEPVIRELTTDMLSHLGFNAFTASNSKEGLEIIKKNLNISSRIETVILDLHLKDDLDAVSILKMIKLIDKDIRVIICSGSPRDPFLTRYLEYGFYKALLKPFNLNDLNNALK